MVFDLFIWYCQPKGDGLWVKVVDNAFGSYTPCAIDTLVISISNLVLIGLSLYRIWLIKTNLNVQRFRLSSNYYNYLLILLASYGTVEPLIRLFNDISVFNLDGERELAPFEVNSLVIESLTWCSMLFMVGLETRVYIREFRWYVRFGIFYVLVGNAVLLNLIFSMRNYYNRTSLYMYISSISCQVLFGALLAVYVPKLAPYPSYLPLQSESLVNFDYEELARAEQVCPERYVSLFSSKGFFKDNASS